MSSLRVVTFSAEDEDQTAACTGDRPVTTFFANDFWFSASATNGKELTPSDLDSVASFAISGGQLRPDACDATLAPGDL